MSLNIFSLFSDDNEEAILAGDDNNTAEEQAPNEELESWEQTVDEILEDENGGKVTTI